MNKSTPLLGLYGGTFDPVHHAHIIPVQQAAQQVGIEKIRLLPCHVPPHKNTPKTAPHHRLEMVKLVANAHPIFEVDDRELRRHKASYTVDTLEEINQEFDEASTPQTLAFFVGSDSIASFDKWHRWRDIFEYCHLVVCSRPGYQDKIKTLHPEISARVTAKVSDLYQQANGKVFFAETDEIPISSTLIREKLAQDAPVDAYLPDYILSYIRQHHLYLT
ncbi:nicotinate-nucleotide adenylyltransferase [Alteromonas sp. a30]|uniref:nicotinate-nucleotide adenylyltransferase n=1 Tax=Alteromonas sp. a30 TaxID=2730917 RepID=UPI002280AB94|nr:nicotinate-nucleotide adenylyltransferase [Alteromonas sp. a30]MCY7297120.1 nicotinate-nucleotide adenylyltransferase [Alteromonas sp. a30]